MSVALADLKLRGMMSVCVCVGGGGGGDYANELVML